MSAPPAPAAFLPAGLPAPAPPGPWRRWRKAPFFSPRGFLLRAALLAAVFLVLDLAGLRECTAAFSLTPGQEGGSLGFSLALGALYALAWLGAAVLAPVFVLAAGIMAVLGRILGRTAAGSGQ